MNVKIIPQDPMAPGRKKVGIYCRVSTKSEDQLRSLRAQISYLVQMCSGKFDMNLTDMYVDICSGDDRFKSRPEFSRMLGDVQRGKINYIVTKSSSRFGRDTLTVLKAIRLLQAHGACAYFDTEEIESSDPSAEFIISIHSSVNQAENENRSANVRWGIHKAVSNGKSKRYMLPCYGYQKKPDGELEINEREAEVVRKIFSWRAEGKTIPQIIALLDSAGIHSRVANRSGAREVWMRS